MTAWRRDRKLLLVVTGGIAAYKAPELVRRLQDQSFDVQVLLSEGAEAFVSELVLGTLTGHHVWTQKDYLDAERGAAIPHISLARWADVVLVAPATAAQICRLAQGDCACLASAVCLITKAPVLVCPAMNCDMLDHPATAANLRRVTEYGYHLLPPDSGMLACHEEGKGRLPDPAVILEALWPLLAPEKPLQGKKVLVTAGPTREFLDPVRFVSNPSTGKMGLALARAARDLGAQVTVLWGPGTEPLPWGVDVVPVVSADDLLEGAKKYGPDADYLFAVAAVGDYKPAEYSLTKLKREGHEMVQRTFVRNPDVAAWLGAHKKPGAVLVGFAAETENLQAEALGKMERKGLDAIAANDVSASGCGFGSNENRVEFFQRQGGRQTFSGTKQDVADAILGALLDSRE